MSDTDNDVEAQSAMDRAISVCWKRSAPDSGVQDTARAALDTIRASKVTIPGMVKEELWRSAEQECAKWRAEAERWKERFDDEWDEHRKNVRMLNDGHRAKDKAHNETVDGYERRLREGDETLSKLRAEAEQFNARCAAAETEKRLAQAERERDEARETARTALADAARQADRAQEAEAGWASARRTNCDYNRTIAEIERERDEARDRYELATALLRAEVERLKVDASNHAADAEAVRRERDRLAEIGGGK